MQYRSELKFLCKESDLQCIENKMAFIMKSDKNGINGRYTIRSLYFDSYDNRCFQDNEKGLDVKSKFRIRIYGDNYDLIKLEIKHKNRGLTAKESCAITKEIYYAIFNRKLTLEHCTNDCLKKFYIAYMEYALEPKIIVEYDRTAYIHNAGNTRITFDRNIRCSRNIEKFFEQDLLFDYILLSSENILEVKYDEFLPDHLRNLLTSYDLNQIAFSKYYLSRERMVY